MGEQPIPSTDANPTHGVGATNISLKAHLTWLHLLLGAVTAYLTGFAIHYAHNQYDDAAKALASLVAMLAGLSWLIWLTAAFWTMHAFSTPVPPSQVTPLDWFDGEDGERVRK
jgi:hypothetical protein